MRGGAVASGDRIGESCSGNLVENRAEQEDIGGEAM
jgi:hypothetical protein